MQVMIIPVTPIQQNSTLMWCPETMEGAIIDPGGEIKRLIGIDGLAEQAHRFGNGELAQSLHTHPLA